MLWIDFFWKFQVIEEKIGMMEVQNNNKWILCNLFLVYVVVYFLDIFSKKMVREYNIKNQI